MKTRHVFFVIIIMLFIGSVYPLGKIGTNNLPPILFSALRVLFLLIIIFPFIKFKIPSKDLIMPLLLFSLSMGIGVYVFLYLSISTTSLISPIIIGAQLAVPFGLILSFFFLNEKISIKKWFFILLAFIGVVIVAYDPRMNQDLISLFFISIMAFFYALSNMFSRFLLDIDTKNQIGWHCLISCIPLFILSFIIEGNTINLLSNISFSTLIILLHASIIVSLISHGGMFYLYKFYPVSSVLPFYSLFPIFGVFLTYIIFLELPNIYEYIGGGIVILSVYFIHLENKKE